MENAFTLYLSTFHCSFISEFCGHQNVDISLSPGSTPDKNAVEYELEPAPKMEEEDEEEKPDNEATATEKRKPKSDGGRRDHLVIFTVDISGSMNITTEVKELQGRGK